MKSLSFLSKPSAIAPGERGFNGGGRTGISSEIVSEEIIVLVTLANVEHEDFGRRSKKSSKISCGRNSSS
jgi:hypothetical protein